MERTYAGLGRDDVTGGTGSPLGAYQLKPSSQESALLRNRFALANIVSVAVLLLSHVGALFAPRDMQWWLSLGAMFFGLLLVFALIARGQRGAWRFAAMVAALGVVAAQLAIIGGAAIFALLYVGHVDISLDNPEAPSLLLGVPMGALVLWVSISATFALLFWPAWLFANRVMR
jgi:hypothetical protein